MKYDGKINLALGRSANSRKWKNETWLWSELAARLSEEHKTNETFKEFIAATKPEQGQIKDVGGYVGGYLRAGKRSPSNVVNRQLLTLDIDFANLDFWDSFTMFYECAALIHGTHKHCETSPRYRLVIPVDRELSPDEYVAVSRQVAGTLGIDLFDTTTFQTNRLMFWPSNPKDVDYYCEQQDGPWLNADEVLASYIDWTDSSLWPTTSKTFDEVRTLAKKQSDPLEKRGIIGAFCNAYTVAEAMEVYLKEDYATTDQPDRYTYLKGTTTAGLIVYEDKFAFSHHGTDPISGKLCNVFDLVRVHRFGHLDHDSQAKTQSLKSFKAMEDFARNDRKVKKRLAEEALKGAKYEFADTEEAKVEEVSIEWAEDLEVDGKGKYTSTANNLNLIFENDPHLKGKLKLNSFDGKRYACGSLPWRKIDKPEPLKNVDYSGVRNYIESAYGIAGNLKVDDALALSIERETFHPVKEYLEALAWDGVPRVDSLLIEYFGAEDTVYTREAIRKMLVGAVARIYRPGIKFDLVLTLVGNNQGTGKSTFIKKLGGAWFSDSFMTVKGKEAFEQLQGAWLIEMAELAGLRKAEIESVKHFLTKQEDSFRPAYGRTSETYPRQCVFFGTTNNKDFLKDPSGNRRFLPVDVRENKATKDVLFTKELDNDVDQIWAEAVELYNMKEKLYLSKEAEALARTEQRSHSETDEREGLITDYLDRLYPEDWKTRDIFDRRTYLGMEEDLNGEVKQFVCAAEVWCECLGKDKQDMSRYNTREINDILKGLEGWEASTSTKNFSIYGKQKYYKRI